VLSFINYIVTLFENNLKKKKRGEIVFFRIPAGTDWFSVEKQLRPRDDRRFYHSRSGLIISVNGRVDSVASKAGDKRKELGTGLRHT
jgi:hypothetical protein